MKNLKLKYFQSKNYKFVDLIYLNLRHLNHLNLKKILKNKKYKHKLIIVKSKKTNIKILKRKVFNFVSKFSVIKNKLSKLDDMRIKKKIVIKQSKKDNFNYLKKIINKEGVLFKNSNVKNPIDIKINFMKRQINSRLGKLFFLYLDKKIVAYLFIIKTKKVIQFYDVNIIHPKKNGYLIIYLFKFIFQNLKANRKTKLITNIHAKNLKSIKFFKSLGFRVNKSYFLQTITNRI